MNEKIKLDYVDALRGFAILFVIFAHTGQMYPLDYPQSLKNLYGFGARGVQLFFIVSAFTLFLSGERRFLQDKKPIQAFFIRRFFRIAPLFYFGIVVYSLISDPARVTTGNILRHVFFINDLYPFHSLVPGGWSISVEMLFYLIVPILFLKIKNLNTAVYFTICCLFIALVSKVILDKFLINVNPEFRDHMSFPYFFTFSLPVFGIGISFYYILFKKDYYVNPFLLIILPIFLLISTIYKNGIFDLYLQTIAFGFVAFVLSLKHNHLFTNKLTMYFGKISYSMYICHFAVLDAIEYYAILKVIPTEGIIWITIYFIVKFIVCIFISTCIATLLFHLIEVPGQNLGKRLIKRFEKNATITQV